MTEPHQPPKPSGLRLAVWASLGALAGLLVGLGLAATCEGGGTAGLVVLLAAATLLGTRLGVAALWTYDASRRGPDDPVG
jgi:hypothetical protein